MYEVTDKGSAVEGFARKADAVAWVKSDPRALAGLVQCEIRPVKDFLAAEWWKRGPRGGWVRDRD